MQSLRPNNSFSADGDLPFTGGLTFALVDQLLAHRFDELPDDIVERAKHCLLDYVACAIAGADDNAAARLVREQALEDGTGPCSIIAHSGRLSALQAALVNGTAGHALDYDDCILMLPGHLTVTVLPALWALAEQRGCSGAQLTTAFVAAFEFGVRVARLVTTAHYERGFHATATIGSVAAAAGCAYLLGLSRQQSASAIAIAATQSAGLKAMFGTMCKPLHAGKAAQNGLYAAQLASRGFEGRGDILECAQGFAAAMSPGCDVDAALADAPREYYLRENLFKFHASCYGTQGAINAARTLREQHNLDRRELVCVTARVSAANATICNIESPRTGNEAKFSIKQMTAWALEGVDTSSLRTYEDARVHDPETVALREKIHVVFEPNLSMTQAQVTVMDRRGQSISVEHDAGVPMSDLTDEHHKLEDKFHALASPAFGDSRSRQLAAILVHVDKLATVREVVQLWNCGPSAKDSA